MRGTAPAVAVLVVFLAACGNAPVEEEPKSGFSAFAGPHFGLVAPSAESEILLPGLVSTDKGERCVTFLDSGRVCLLTTDDGGTWFTTLKAGRWTEIERFPFNYADDMIDYTAGPDGRTLVFMTSRPIAEDDPGTTHHLWTVEWSGYGWEDPVPLPAPEKIEGLGAGYPALAADGTIYFISDARDGATEGGIYRSVFENGSYLEPELIEHPVNTPYIDFDPTVAPDHSYLIFASNRPGGFGLWDHYVVFRKPGGGWSSAFNLGAGFNSEYSEACPNVTPDGGLFIFASARPSDFLLDDDFQPVATGRDVYWADTSVIDALRVRFQNTASSAELVRRTLESENLEAAVAVFEDLFENHHAEYSFTPSELLEICAELAATGDAAGADRFFDALMRILPEKDRIRLGYAVICALDGRLDESGWMIRELRSNNPDFNLEYAVLNVGVHIGRASETDDEIAHYEAFLEDLPGSYRVRYYLAAAYERGGETGRALEVCRLALDLQPGHPYLIEMVERLSDRAAS